MPPAGNVRHVIAGSARWRMRRGTSRQRGKDGWRQCGQAAPLPCLRHAAPLPATGASRRAYSYILSWRPTDNPVSEPLGLTVCRRLNLGLMWVQWPSLEPYLSHGRRLALRTQCGRSRIHLNLLAKSLSSRSAISMHTVPSGSRPWLFAQATMSASVCAGPLST